MHGVFFVEENRGVDVEYFAFGELFVEEGEDDDVFGDDDGASPRYLFNAKELDEETGLYYYGARYYDARTSVFLSIDPMADKYPAISPYAYAFNNPLKYIDPTGMEGEEAVNSDPPGLISRLVSWFKGDQSYKGSGWGHGARQSIAKKLGIDNKASNVAEVGVLSQLQFDEVQIEGQALDKIKSDPAMIERESELVKLAESDPNFGKKEYSFVQTEVVEFGGKRAPQDMAEQLKDPLNPKYADTWNVAKNELTWLVRHASVKSSVTVDKKGNIIINHTLTDQFDLRPSSGRSGAYNTVNRALGTMYHDMLGGNDKLKIKATWNSKR